jgi:hypothetical protein
MKSARDIEGPWKDPDFDTGLIQRCGEAWETPIDQLSDEKLATFLRQEIAFDPVIEEAHRRVECQNYDDSEMYDGELEKDLKEALTHIRPPKSRDNSIPDNIFSLPDNRFDEPSFFPDHDPAWVRRYWCNKQSAPNTYRGSLVAP